MPRSRSPRTRPDPIAIATQGRVTSQIDFQDSGDKPTIISTKEEI